MRIKKRLRTEIKSKRRELSQIREEVHAAEEWSERSEQIRRMEKKRLEIHRLKKELRAVEEGTLVGWLPPFREGAPWTGALPDFVVIGAAKGGTTFLYHLLSQHQGMRWSSCACSRGSRSCGLRFRTLGPPPP